MSNIAIETTRCTACGACVGVCPAFCLALNGGSAVIANDSVCISCGHCAAACPSEAIAMTDTTLTCPGVDPGLVVTPNALMQVMRTRRSIRAYTDEPVSKADIEALIEAARYAPTGHNDQPWHFDVFLGKERVAGMAEGVIGYIEGILHQMADRERREAFIAALPASTAAALQAMTPFFRMVVKLHRSGVDMIFRGAPALIVIHARPGAASGVEDCHYAAANIMLMAHAMGLGTCVAGFLVGSAAHSPDLRAMVGIPDDHQMGTALMLGHPRHGYQRIAPRRAAPVEWM